MERRALMRDPVLARMRVDLHPADRIDRWRGDILMTMIPMAMGMMIMLMFVKRCHLDPISFAGYTALIFIKDGASHGGKVNGVAAPADPSLARQTAALLYVESLIASAAVEPILVWEGIPARTDMTTGSQTRASRCRAVAGWAFLCLVLGFFALTFSAAPASADVHDASLQIVSASADGHSDCDDGHADMPGHCHSTTACFGYVQAATQPLMIEFVSSEQLKAASPESLTSRSLLPSLQPPKRSIQA